MTAALLRDDAAGKDNQLRLFQVAIQHKEGATLDLYQWRAHTGVELVVGLKRMYKIGSLAGIPFLEVHEILPGGAINVMYGDINRAWPTGAVIKKFEGIVRGKGSDFEKNNLENYNVGSKVMETKIDVKKVAEKISEPEKFPNEKDVGIRPLEIKVA